MALALIGGAAVGAVFGELARACMDVKDKAVMFRPTMDQLEHTIKSLEPVIKEIELYNHELNRPQSEIESLIRVMEGGKKLLCKCSRIRRWYDVRKVRYQKKLVALDKSLLRFLNVDLQAQMARNQMQILLLFRSTIIGPDHRGRQDLTVGMTIFRRTVRQIGHTQRDRLLTKEILQRDLLLKKEILQRRIWTALMVNRAASDFLIKNKAETNTILEINVQSDGPGCYQDFIIQRQIEEKAILKDGYKKQGSWTFPSDLWRWLNQQSKRVGKVKCKISSSNISEDLRYQNSNISSLSGTMITGSRVSEYSETEGLAHPPIAVRYQNPNSRMITASRNPQQYQSETEGLALPPAAVRYQNPNSRMITALKNPQQYQRSIMPTSSASDQNSWRISDYDETNKNTLCEGRNHNHIERVALPLPSDETSAGKHEKEYEKSATQHGSQIMQRLHVLEGIAGKMKLLTPTIVLLGCFNLVMSFLILMYK